MPYMLISTQIRLVRMLHAPLRSLSQVLDLPVQRREEVRPLHRWKLQENGPTNVGDEHSDPLVMNYLGARKTTMLGNNFSEYHVDDPPRLVLDKLEKIGFHLLSMTGVGQTLVWCLHRKME